MDFEQLQQLVRSTPPRCLRRFQTIRVPSVSWNDNEDVASAWKVSCPCGSGEVTILGHPLGELKPGYENDPMMVSPFSLHCVKCGATTELLDTDVDGTGAELARLFNSNIGCAAYRGEGEGKPFLCIRCGKSAGEVVVDLYFKEDYVWDLQEDDIDFPFENLFSGVSIYFRCSACGKRLEVTNIDTKH